MRYTSLNMEETRKIAEDFAKDISPKEDEATVVGLYGNLGAGKTFFTQAIAKTFGVLETVTSPTFVIEKIYELQDQKFTRLIHIDAYRLDSSKELLQLGWNEIISDTHNLICIEWPERVADVVSPHIKISLKTLESGEGREIEIL